MMTIQDLLDELTSLIEDGTDPETEVKVALQPNYPLAASVSRVTALEDDDDDELVVWIATREATEYAPREAWR